MIWFEYEYTAFSEVIKSLKIITDYTINDLITLIIWLVLIVLFVFYIIPINEVYRNSQKIKKEKLRKRDLLRKISLQKNIEDKIAKEINIW